MSDPKSYERLLSPIDIGGVGLKNRVVMAPISNHMSTEAFTEREAAFNLARARGGVGLIIVGATFVHNSGRSGEDLGLHTDANIPAFRSYNDRLHEYGGKSSIQLYHLGRYATGASGSPPVAPSAEPWPPGNQTPHALSVPEIQELVEAWGQAAARAKKAGFDMIEVHSAHGYLPAQFLSLHANHRDDEYGGSLENRARFLMEVMKSCRAALGEGVPIHVRISNAEYIENGLTIEDQVKVSQMLERAGAAFISVSSGLSPCWGHTRTLPSMVHEQGLNVADAARIKAAVNIPVMVTGRLADPIFSNRVLAEGKADLIGMARGLICDPDFVNKLAEGRAEELRPCISCNNCHNRELSDRSTRCLYNVEAGREMDYSITPAEVKKKVFIAGGGPAGLEAARVARLKGHDVVLFERGGVLGGRLRLASVPPHKDEYAKAVDFCIRELDRLGVEVRMKTALTRADVESEKPDAVIVATGAATRFPRIEGINNCQVATADQVLETREAPGQKMLVIGGGPVGAETAHFLAARGKSVTIVEMLSEIVPDMLPDFRWFLFQDFEKYGVKVLVDTVVTAIDGRTVTVKSKGGERTLTEIDLIVIGTGGVADDDLARSLEGAGAQIKLAGDVSAPRDAVQAYLAGYMAAYHL